MPIHDYYCKRCSNSDSPYFVYDTPNHPGTCPNCGEELIIYLGNFSFGIKPSSEVMEYRTKKARFEKRNKRIMNMTPKQQEGFKRIIDSTGGKRYIP